MQAVKTIGLDITKSVFQVHGVDADGQHDAPALARSIASTAADQGRRHRAGQQTRTDGVGDDDQV